MQGRCFYVLLLIENLKKDEIDLMGIRDEVETFMFEGHDTTAAAMSFMVHSLGSDFNIRKTVQSELDENLKNMHDDDSSFYEKLDNFYIDHTDLDKIEYGAR